MTSKTLKPLHLNINNQKPFQELMKESFSRSKTKKNSQSSEFAFGASITKEKLTNPLKTLSDLCTNTTSTFRDHSSHRVLKPFSTLSPFPLDMKSLSPTFRKSQGGKRAFSHSLVQGIEANTVLNLQKVEENENQNIQAILTKVRLLEENKSENEVSELKALEKSLEVKDMIIEIYQQLIKVCTNKKMSLLPLKKNVASNHEGSSKQGLQNKGNKHYTGLRKPFMIDSPGISSSFNTVQKSTNPTLSRISHFSPEKNDSPYTSKFTDQESISYKEEVSASSPRLKSSIQSSPLQFPQKPLGKIDNRIKTLESIYKFGFKHFKKESLSPLKSSSILPAQIINELSPFKEKTPYKRKNNSVYNFTEPDLYSGLQEPSSQSPMKLDPGSLTLQSLNGFVKRLDSVLSKYETQRSKLLKKNMQIKSHFEQKSLLKSK